MQLYSLYATLPAVGGRVTAIAPGPQGLTGVGTLRGAYILGEQGEVLASISTSRTLALGWSGNTLIVVGRQEALALTTNGTEWVWNPNATVTLAAISPTGRAIIYYNGTLASLSPSGEIEWTATLSGAPKRIVSSPDYVAITLYNESTTSVILYNGAGHRVCTLNTSAAPRSIALHGRVLLVLGGAHLSAYDVSAGCEELWLAGVPENSSIVVPGPSAVAVVAEKRIFIIKYSDGSLENMLQASATITGVSWISSNEIVVGLTGGSPGVLAYDAINGTILWGADTSSSVTVIAASPVGDNGRIIGGAATRGGRILLFRRQGPALWTGPLDGAAGEISFSRSGTVAIVDNDTGRIIVATPGLNVQWTIEPPGPASVAWGECGLLAAAIANETSKKIELALYGPGGLVANKTSLNLATAGNRAPDISWSPTSNMIAIATSNGLAIVDAPCNGEPWTPSPVQGALSWSPEGSLLAVGTGHTLRVVDPSSGATLWSKTLNTTIRGVSWNNEGLLAVLAGTKLLIYSSAGDVLVAINATVSAAWGPGKLLATEGGGVIHVYTVNESSALLIASTRGEGPLSWSPGGLLSFYDPHGRLVIAAVANGTLEKVWAGNASQEAGALSSWPGNLTYMAVPEGHGVAVYKAEAGLLIVRASGATYNVTLLSPQGESSFTVPLSTKKIILLEPGDYTLWAEIPPQSPILERGLPGINYYVRNATRNPFTAAPGSIIEIVIPSPLTLLARLSIWSQEQATVTIKSPLGEANATGTSFFWWAPPGYYTVNAELEPPPEYVGPATALQVSFNVTLDAGVHRWFSLPGYDYLLGKILLRAPSCCGISMNISWSGGNISLALPAGDSIRLWAAPGLYNISYSILGPSPGVIGTPVPLNGSVPVNVTSRATSIVYLPSPQDLTPEITLVAPSTFWGSVNISWGQGSFTVHLVSGDVETLKAYPGTYEVVAELDPPGSVLGGPGTLVFRYNVTVSWNDSTVLTLPDALDYLSLATIWTSGGTVRLTLSNGTAHYSKLYIGYSTDLLWLYPGNYTVSYELEPPNDTIGDLSALRDSYTLSVPSPGRTIPIILPGIDSVLGKVTIKLGPEAGATITVSWSNGSTTLALGPYSERTFYAAPGEYSVTARYTRSDNMLAAPPVVKGSFNVTASRETVYTVPPPSTVLATLVLDAGSEAMVFNVTGPGGTVTLVLNHGERITLLVEPGNYTVTVSPFIQGIRVVGPPGSLSINFTVSAGPGQAVEIVAPPRIEGRIDIPVPPGVGGVLRLEAQGQVYEIPLSPGRGYELAAAPGVYNYSLEPEIRMRVLGPSPLDLYAEAARGTLVVSRGSTVLLLLPRLDQVFAQLRVIAAVPGELQVQGPQASYTVNCTGESTVYLVPGNEYNISFKPFAGLRQLPIAGPIKKLYEDSSKGVLKTLRPAPGEHIELTVGEELERVIESLAILRVTGPPGAVLQIAWPGGSLPLTIGAAPLRVYLVPGTVYTVSAFDPNNWTVSPYESIAPSPGETINITILKASPHPSIVLPQPGPANESITLTIPQPGAQETPGQPPSPSPGTRTPTPAPGSAGKWRILALGETLLLVLVFLMHVRVRRRGG